MDVSEERLKGMLLSAINSVSDKKFADLPMGWRLADTQLDSLGLSQVVLFLEETLGCQLEERVLLKLVEAETIGDFLVALRKSLSPA